MLTMQIPAISIPTIITIILLVIMFRPYHEHGMFDTGAIFRLFWLIPILSTWLLYFALT